MANSIAVIGARRRRRGNTAPPVTIIGDTFTRADSAISLGSTETGTRGVVAWSTPVGTWGISSNRAYCPTPVSDGVALVDAGTGDVQVSATLVTATVQAGVVARALNGTSLVRFVWSGGSLFLQANAVNLAASVLYTIQPNDVFKLSCIGTAINGYVNGTLMMSGTSALNQALPNCGITSSAAAERIDNFLVTA